MEHSNMVAYEFSVDSNRCGYNGEEGEVKEISDEQLMREQHQVELEQSMRHREYLESMTAEERKEREELIRIAKTPVPTEEQVFVHFGERLDIAGDEGIIHVNVGEFEEHIKSQCKTNMKYKYSPCKKCPFRSAVESYMKYKGW